MSTINKIYSILGNREKKVVFNNFLSLTLLQGANYILPLLVLPFLVRVLGAEKFGLVMFAQSFATFLSVFVDFGFNISGTREISLSRNNTRKISEIFISIITIKIILTLAAFGVLYFAATFFDRFNTDPYVYLLSFGVVIGQALFPAWFFQGIEKMQFVSLINILSKTIFTILIFVFIKSETDYLMVPVYNSLGFIVSGIFGILISLRYLKLTAPSLSLTLRLFKESYSLFLSNFALSMYTASNVFILGLFSGNIIAGVYSSMEKLILAIKNIYVPIYQAIYPWLSRKKAVQKKNIINKISPFIFVFSTSVTLMILIFAKSILNIIYSNTIISGYVNVFRVLSFISIFSGLNMLYNMLYFPSKGLYTLRMKILICGAVFNVSMNLIVVNFYGIYGVAIIVVLTELLLFILGYYNFRKSIYNI